MKTKLLTLLLVLFIGSLYAQDGILDNTFGSNGIIITDVSPGLDDIGYSVIVKDNGKFIITGYAVNDNGNKDFTLVQYNQDGVIDSSFGDNGIVLLDINGTNDYAFASAIQSDGKIITVGYTTNTDSDIAIIRFNSDGSIDNSYANNGIFIYDYGFGNDEGWAIIISSDGNAFVGCKITNESLEDDYAVLKITEEGILDNSFGNNGITVTDIGGTDAIRDIKLQSDGKILITGTSSDDVGGFYDKTLIRYNVNGDLDSSFNSNGIIFTSFEDGGDDGGYSISIKTDGKIIVCGSSSVGIGDDNFALAQYNSDGSIDASFGTGGVTITDFGSSYDLCYSSLIQNNGKIILGGFVINGTTFNWDFGIVRYNTDGSIDTGFGTNGFIITDLNNGSIDVGSSLAFQSDDKLLLAGKSKAIEDSYNFSVARYVIDNSIGIEEKQLSSSDFILYPNPATNHIKIYGNSYINQIVKIEIFSINEAKKIKTYQDYYLTTYRESQYLSVDDLSPGIYIIKISNSDFEKHLKLIIQ